MIVTKSSFSKTEVWLRAALIISFSIEEAYTLNCGARKRLHQKLRMMRIDSKKSQAQSQKDCSFCVQHHTMTDHSFTCCRVPQHGKRKSRLMIYTSFHQGYIYQGRIARTSPGQRKNTATEAYVVQAVHSPRTRQNTSQVWSCQQGLLVSPDQQQEGQRIRTFLICLRTMSLSPEAHRTDDKARRYKILEHQCLAHQRLQHTVPQSKFAGRT